MADTNKKTSKDTETLILEAAEQEFLAKGFAAARTTSIAEAAGVTHGMLHYYYRTKEKLFEKILSEKFNRLADIFLGLLLSSEGTFTERVADAVGRHFDFIAANPRLPAFIFTELNRDSHIADSVIDELRERAVTMLGNLQRDIDSAAAAGECCPIDAVMLVMDAVALNLFPFVAANLIKLSDFAGNYDTLLAMRRRENIEVIIRRLKP